MNLYIDTIIVSPKGWMLTRHSNVATPVSKCTIIFGIAVSVYKAIQAKVFEIYTADFTNPRTTTPCTFFDHIKAACHATGQLLSRHLLAPIFFPDGIHSQHQSNKHSYDGSYDDPYTHCRLLYQPTTQPAGPV